MYLIKRLFLIMIQDTLQKEGEFLDTYRNMSDEDLVMLIAKDNNTSLFALIYDRYAQKVYNKCFSFVKSREEAEDLTQDIFLQTFMKLGSFEGRARFSSWLYSLSYNFCANYVNRNKERRMNRISRPIEDEGKEFMIDVDEDNLMQFQVDKLKKALGMVSPEEKSLLLLKYQDGLSLKELMQLLNVGESAVKMRLKRARSKIVQSYNTLN